MAATVFIRGLGELTKTIRKLEKGARKEVRSKLRGVGDVIAEQAKANARAQGLEGSYKRRKGKTPGRLVRQIRPKLHSSRISIQATARTKSDRYPAGYNYPARHEFGDGKKRAFLFPALEQKREAAFREMEKVMDWMEREWGR